MTLDKEIAEVIRRVVPKYNVKNVTCFGSYASGKQTKKSDLDLLVEFDSPFVSLYDVIGLESEIEEALRLPVDIATYPLPIGSRLEIGETVKIYESQK